MTSGLKRLYVHGFPSLYGGAGTELHHRIILRRKMGMEVHRTPAWDCLRKQQVAEDDSAMAPTLYEYEAFGNFAYGYLAGSNLLETLTMPNDMTLTQSYEVNRDLLTDMVYKRGEDMVTHRSYSYDEIGRPTARGTDYPLKDIAHHDSFGYNNRSELTQAQLDDSAYTYAYDNIGNRESAQEAADELTTYSANELNQYTSIQEGEQVPFEPEFDLAGNQILVKTKTGIWHVTYNAENRPVKFTSEDGSIIVECAYDYLGRRAFKKVTTDGAVKLHQRYIYRGYLQIAALDLVKANHPVLWHIIWDPTQPIATRPLAIRKDGVWYAYGWDLTKNICEVYGQTGYIRTLYTYTPYGEVTADGDVGQPIQWSSEMYDAETDLVYYNYRYYSPHDGRWTRRDPVGEEVAFCTYAFVSNVPSNTVDLLGLKKKECVVTIVWGHGHEVDLYIKDQYKKYDPKTTAFGPFGCQVKPAPPGYAILGFPDLHDNNLGIEGHEPKDNKRNNAGLNPNGGKTRQDRKEGFARALDKAFNSAKKEARRICKNSCCKSVKVVFLGIKERSGEKGIKILKERLDRTSSKYKEPKTRENIDIPCQKKKK